jgi:hypothetical protein
LVGDLRRVFARRHVATLPSETHA